MRFYRLLLHLYPRSFRNEYGADLRAVFADRRSATSGLFSVIAFWFETAFDILGSAAAVHFDLLRQDVRYAVRALRRAPGFAVTAIVVAALGIGANTAAFSVADFVLIRPLPFPNSDRLVTLWQTGPGYSTVELSPPNYRDWRAQASSFDAIGAYHWLSANLVGQGEPRRLAGASVTGDLLPGLGVHPLLGRSFTPAESRDGATTVVLSYQLWKDQFGGDPAALGRSITLDGRPYVVIGVMPKGFSFPNRDVAIWTPMRREEVADTDRTNNWFQLVARRRPGVTLAQARADMDRVAARLAAEYPVANDHVGAAVQPLRDMFSSQGRVLLLALCGAALCVLLIACANLGGLLLARAQARQRELAVRSALGAGRERLVRQLVTESLLLAFLGGALGVGLAVTAVPLLTRLIPDSLPLAATPTIDLRVLVVAAVLTLATGIVFGVVPASRVSSGADLTALRESARAGGGRRERMRSVLVVTEVMSSVVLLVSAGLLMRAMWRIQSVDPGFRADSVMTMRTSIPEDRYGITARRTVFYNQVLTAIRAIPGVQGAAYASFLPIAMGGGIWGVSLDGQPEQRTGRNSASLRYVTPGYFSTMRIPIRRGRAIDESDKSDGLYSAVVSESFVKHFWPGVDPLGKKILVAYSQRTVVGVAGDVRVRGLERVAEPQVYVPYNQVPDSSIVFYIPKDLVIRSSVAPGPLVAAVRRIVHEADPEIPISNVRTLEEIVAGQTASRSVQVRILGAFALIAILLAGVGIHGLLAFTVQQRSREIGVRRALGAQPQAIVGLVMRQGALLALAGLIPGVVLAYVAARALGAVLAGVGPADPLTFVVAVTVCALMTLLGSLLPTLRAVRVDPNVVMRGE